MDTIALYDNFISLIQQTKTTHMKTKITFFLVLFSSFYLHAQIKTKVFTLDLGKPHKGSLTVLKENEDDTLVDITPRLVIKNSELLSFNLINGNPYKYNYIINHKLVNFLKAKCTTL